MSGARGMSEPVQLGIVGLGRWARVLTRAAQRSKKLKIVAGHTRTPEKRPRAVMMSSVTPSLK